MDEYEQKTCLKFKLHDPTRTYVQHIIFESYSYKGCRSNSIGKRKAHARQYINLRDPGCDYSAALHEIGHAIGFWHEQTRPDRNNYITINWNNIHEVKQGNFKLRREVDYQDEKYDYGSIMHYELDAFSSNDKPTMVVKNPAKYSSQGSTDKIGNPAHLSPGDIRLVNKLYKCYNPQGYQGRLRVDVIKATGLPMETYYAEITAYDRNGRKQTYATHDAVYTGENSWNDVFTTFRSDWRYFELRIKNRYGEPVFSRQTIWVKPRGQRVSDSYCVGSKEDENDDEYRNSCVYFKYQIIY